MTLTGLSGTDYLQTFNQAFRIVKWFIDPGLEGDVYADKPYLYGPALSSWNFLRIYKKVIDPPPSDSGANGSIAGRCRTQSQFMRRWSRKELKEVARNEAGRLYQSDFGNPLLDFNDFSLKLPGFSLNVIKYVDSKTHQLRHKYQEVPSEGQNSDAMGWMGKAYRQRYFKDSTFDALSVLESVLEKHKLTTVETALHWCIHHSALRVKGVKDGNNGLVIGVSSLEQSHTNLADCEKEPLPEEVVKVLDHAWMTCKLERRNRTHLRGTQHASQADTAKAV